MKDFHNDYYQIYQPLELEEYCLLLSVWFREYDDLVQQHICIADIPANICDSQYSQLLKLSFEKHVVYQDVIRDRLVSRTEWKPYSKIPFQIMKWLEFVQVIKATYWTYNDFNE